MKFGYGIFNQFKGYNSSTTIGSLTKLNVHQCPIVIYIYSKFYEIRFKGYLVKAHYMDFKSIQGLYNSGTTKARYTKPNSHNIIIVIHI